MTSAIRSNVVVVVSEFLGKWTVLAVVATFVLPLFLKRLIVPIVVVVWELAPIKKSLGSY